MIILDTSLLSVVFRRRRQGAKEVRVQEVYRGLVAGERSLAVPGIVCQELLSGARDDEMLRRLDLLLLGFPLLLATRQDHALAAHIRNGCRRVGVAVGSVDCLIAAHAVAHGASLFTLDQDFTRMAPHCGLKLYTWTHS
jgi:predicted nucleic acid-binding protein